MTVTTELPSVTLPYGYIFVYGSGVAIGVYDNQATNTQFVFGTIYGVGVNMGNSIIGQSVCFDSTKTVCALAWNEYPFTIVAASAVICTEVAPAII